ncbi:MAG: gamma carbonic anhydrase family protein [Alphaproteobacteria bacterium]|nr:gamma carbonic anhydrase family protein [Alphaproteobacteria bacterium]
MEPLILPYKGKSPKIAPSAFIAPGAVIIGDVEIGEDTNIWFGCVIRGDINSIRIGNNTNVQDGTVVHVTHEVAPTYIGSNVTIGHKAIIHGCTLEDGSFVGMGATVMDKAIIKSEGMLAAGALLTPGKQVRGGELWAGSPAKFFRDLTREETQYIYVSAQHYVDLGQNYIREMEKSASIPPRRKK